MFTRIVTRAIIGVVVAVPAIWSSAAASQPPGQAGCGAEAVSDPADRTLGRAVARCEAGFPEPSPLAERTTFVLANAFTSEYVAPILLAEQYGEFDAENLDVEIVPLTMEDAVAQLTTGEIDAVNAAPNASWFNAHATGISLPWVLGNFHPPSAGDPDVAQTGLWARREIFSDPDAPDLSELAGHPIGSAVGAGSAIAYPISAAFAEAGVDPSTIEYETLPPPDVLSALQNGAVDVAWILDPFWLQLADSDEFVLLVTQPPGEPLGGIFMSQVTLDDEPEVARAFVRALIRTVNTYLSGPYHDDDEVMSAISEATGVEVDQIRRTPEVVFDWEIRSGTADRAQESFLAAGVLGYDELLPEDELVDRSLYDAVVGAA